MRYGFIVFGEGAGEELEVRDDSSRKAAARVLRLLRRGAEAVEVFDLNKGIRMIVSTSNTPHALKVIHEVHEGVMENVYTIEELDALDKMFTGKVVPKDVADTVVAKRQRLSSEALRDLGRGFKSFDYSIVVEGEE